MKLREWICKKFGHKFDPIQEAIFMCEVNAIGLSYEPKIQCDRCNAWFRPK